MKLVILQLIFMILFLSVNLTDFGKTTVELEKVSGTTVFLNIKTEFNGTTLGNDFTILNLQLFCGSNKLYDIVCKSDKQ